MVSSTPSPSPSPALAADQGRRSPLSEETRLLYISIVCQVQKKLTFKIKGNVPLERLVDLYFTKVSLDRSTVNLVYNGERLNLQHTPDQIGMEDVDEIEAMIITQGGGNRF